MIFTNGIYKSKSTSSEETKRIASDFSKNLKIGDIVLLIGDLGAGKTNFVKGMAPVFGISEDEVTSPSFKLLNQYSGNTSEIYHFDFYRLHYENGFPMFEWDEITETGIAVIEWGNEWNGPVNYTVYIKMLGSTREIIIKKENYEHTCT